MKRDSKLEVKAVKGLLLESMIVHVMVYLEMSLTGLPVEFSTVALNLCFSCTFSLLLFILAMLKREICKSICPLGRVFTVIKSVATLDTSS